MEGIAQHGLRVQERVVAALAPHYDRKKLRNVASDMLRELWRLKQIAQLDYQALHQRQPHGSVDAIAKIYHALEKSTFFDMIREKHFQINPGERPRG